MTKEKYIQTTLSVLVALLLFWLGFLFGNKGSYKPDTVFLNATSTENFIDMQPFWKVWSILDQKFAPSSSTKIVSDQDKLWGAISGLAFSYGDPYTSFFPPEESKSFEEEISGSFGGVGMEIGLSNDGVLTVIAPLKNTPAYRAGVLAGDKIIEIDGKTAIGLSTDEAIKMIRGEKGTAVTITFSRKGEKEPLVKRIIRDSIEIPTVNTKLTPENVFVIELYNFSATSPNLFRQALREFVESGTDKLVIDLRNNPGGYLEASIDIASWFLPAGKVVVIEDFGEDKEDKVYRSKGYDIFNDQLKLAILVNKGSASASEILAGALREYNKAILVGDKTFGKGSVQELIPITDETSLKITVAHWLTPMGNSISEGGLTPDILVETDSENVKDEGVDIVLQKAVGYLLSKK